jgi:hypothetical protein
MADTSVWVGIDGYETGTVEQLGTSSEYNTSTGQASYYAWWEMYPKFSHPVKSMDVNPGDYITAHVKFLQGQSKDRGNFELSLTDVTTGRTFTITQGPLPPGFYLRSSADWVVERAAFYNPTTKQAYFAELSGFDAPITFTNCKAVITTYGGPLNYDRMRIRAPYTGSDYGDAYNNLGPTTRKWTIATTSFRNGDLMNGGSFSVTWVPYETLVSGPWPCKTPEGTKSCPH